MNKNIYSSIGLLRVWSSLSLSVSRNRATTTSLGNLCQFLTILTVGDFSLVPNLNLSYFSLK